MSMERLLEKHPEARWLANSPEVEQATARILGALVGTDASEAFDALQLATWMVEDNPFRSTDY